MLSVGEACVLLCLCTLTNQVKFRSHVGACHLLSTRSCYIGGYENLPA